jgi:hypothetical protein
MFGFWILAVFANNLFVWVLFDYAVASYFLFVAGASWWFTVKNTWEEEGLEVPTENQVNQTP